ncbi:type III-A CRISPR-associated protein Csm2 [Botrimarina hoheduenensis]|uniref:CRISPR system Cms protein Csm2 n=1 Tax=Botrimarina hoheduenensis TaxID=2528000 RepID=A0A5C5VNP2_9BACT|nr:type III-A CRISPR-associated protein Csm2 [Botrimarina hoheduenensis]TWT40214.1 hypothetical protein Pla111_33450 [Botrimarina hoheduenensis]
MSRPYHQQGGHRGGAPTSPPPKVTALFDPSKPDRELYDSLAEQQADSISGEVNSSQLRRYFGELKGLYNQYRAITAGADDPTRQQRYADRIEPRFKMLRSKIAYGRRQSGRQAEALKMFCGFLDDGIQKVNDATQFERFVLHVEAVVGFMYGNGKVSKS